MSDEIILSEPYASGPAVQTVTCVIEQLHLFASREQFKRLINAGIAY